MLKFWPSVSADVTPKAEDVNPFDHPNAGHRTPTSATTPSASSGFHHQLLKNTPNSAPTDPPLTPAATVAAAATTSLSLHAPIFNMQQPPPPKSSPASPSASNATNGAHPPKSALTTPGTASPHPQGQIHVKLIQARGLNIRSSRARPYVVVQFEQNEFVSRDPTDEADKEAKGVPTTLSREPSSTALSALTKVSASRAGSGKSTAVHSPSSSVSSGKSSLANGLFGLRISPHNPVWKHEVSFDVTSGESAITFNVYDRASPDLGFLGTVQIKPVLMHDYTVDQWYKLLPFENETVSGEMRVQVTFEANKIKRALTPRDFEFLKLIGRGTFGRVFQVRKKDTKRIYAMKVLSKHEIIAKNEVAHTIGERKILQRSLECPFLVGLKFSFQTESDLYLVTDFKSGGELFWHLQRETRFSEERARFYVAELVLALEHLHKYDIVYRDLKPENILLDATGHVALCDFGLSKPDLRSDELTNTFCGTTEYLAPEVLLDEHGYSKLVDFWSLGVLLFEMCCGWSPFYAEDTQQMYKNICFGKIRFPKGVINEDGKQFVKGLLNRNPKHRLGAQRDAAELKEHPFFKSIDWSALAKKQLTPPFKPVVESDESVANFDPEFTSANVQDAGPLEIKEPDEEDPSEDWVALPLSASMHMPNGPLGSDKPSGGGGGGGLAQQVSPPSPLPAGATSPGAGIKMPQKKKGREGAGTPLTSSVQENFRGFTYHGESVMPSAAEFLKERREREGEGAGEGQVEGWEVESVESPSSSSGVGGAEEDDGEAPVGRYVGRRKEGHVEGFDA